MHSKILIVTITFASLGIAAEVPDTKGKEFIFAMATTVPPEVATRVVITSELAATGTVEVPGLPFLQNFIVPANGSATIFTIKKQRTSSIGWPRPSLCCS